MNKTIIININGIVFHIEEDAYEILKSYMSEVKRHFAYSKDSEEIVTDIENRLAEMFNERLAQHNKQVIIITDVEEITSQMGKASDFEGDSSEDLFDHDNFKTGRTLYKDNDDKVIGGVCAGLGHYFDLEAKWVRVFAILLVFVSGIGVIAYLILWAVLPVAISRRDKMTMRGEPINLHTFKKSYEEKGENSGNLHEDAFSGYPPRVRNSDPIIEIVNFVGKVLKLFIKIIGGFIIAVGGMALFAMIIGFLFALGFISETGFQQFPLNVINPEYRSQVFFSAFLLLIIPLTALILFAIRVLLNRRLVSGYGSFAMLVLWLTGLGMGVYYGSRIASEFQEEAKLEQTEDLQIYPALTLKLNPKIFFKPEDSLKYDIGNGEFKGRILFGERNADREMNRFELFIEKSDDNKFSAVKELSGRGKSFESALEAAKRVSYTINQQDSILEFDKYLSLTGNGLYRAQEIEVHLKVPVNTVLRIDGKLDSHLRGYNLWDCKPENSEWEQESKWIMTEDGLKCLDEDLNKPSPE